MNIKRRNSYLFSNNRIVFSRDSENENAPSVESRSDSEVSEGSESASASLDYTGPSGFAKSHLEHVSERLQNKLQALTVSLNREQSLFKNGLL